MNVTRIERMKIMEQYMYADFIRHNPDALILAERKLHPDLHENAFMRIYSYLRNNRYGYIFRYENYMVTNPLQFEMAIPKHFLPLFCYEWFLEYETLSGVKEMFENNEEYYWAPNHQNFWKFAKKWDIRFSNSVGYNEGQYLREKRRDDVFSNLKELKRYSTKDELIELKKRLEAYIHEI
jgi:hypothetical protein